jgi:hypothetical protein
MWVQSFSLPASEVKKWHPNAKTGEFYASCQDKKRAENIWTVGPFRSREEAKIAVCEEAIKRNNEDWARGTVEIVDEQLYWMNKVARDILYHLDEHVSDEDARTCFDWALEQRRKRAS